MPSDHPTRKPTEHHPNFPPPVCRRSIPGQLKTVFRRRGLSVSDDELRRWIRQRDTSGTGAVDFQDFSSAFSLRGEAPSTRDTTH